MPRQRPECTSGTIPGAHQQAGHNSFRLGWRGGLHGGGGRPEMENSSWGGGLTVLGGGILGADPLRVGTVSYAGLPASAGSTGLDKHQGLGELLLSPQHPQR